MTLPKMKRKEKLLFALLSMWIVICYNIMFSYTYTHSKKAMERLRAIDSNLERWIDVAGRGVVAGMHKDLNLTHSLREDGIKKTSLINSNVVAENSMDHKKKSENYKDSSTAKNNITLQHPQNNKDIRIAQSNGLQQNDAKLNMINNVTLSTNSSNIAKPQALGRNRFHTHRKHSGVIAGGRKPATRAPGHAHIFNPLVPGHYQEHPVATITSRYLRESERNLSRENGTVLPLENRRDLPRENKKDLHRKNARDLPENGKEIRENARDILLQNRRDVPRATTRDLPREFARISPRENTTPSPYRLDMWVQDIQYKYHVILDDMLPLDVDVVHNEPFFCKNNHINVLMYISSAPGHVKERQFTRETWGRAQSYNNMTYRVIFFVGLTTSNETQKQLDAEFLQYNDVIQLNMMDSYRNLSQKGVASIKWLNLYCSDVDYVIKADDDLVVDIRHMADLVAIQVKPGNHSAPKSLCIFQRKGGIHRKKSKWHVPQNILPNMTYYPPMCLGSFYGYPGFLLPKMHHAAMTTPLFWLEDVYFTGFVLPQAAVTNMKYVNIAPVWKPILTKATFSPSGSARIFFDPGLDMAPKYWDLIQARYKKGY